MIAVVAVIIIMNTLVISSLNALRDRNDAGDWGAEELCVENGTARRPLTGLSGVLGITVGGAVLAVLNVAGIEATNMFLKSSLAARF